MKYLISLILLTISQIHASELVLNRYEGKEGSVDIYHLIDDNEITCKERVGKQFETEIHCKLSKPIAIEKEHREDSFFHIYFRGNEIIFVAKAYAKLLPTDTKLITKETIIKPKRYYHWTIIGSQKEPEILKDEGEIAFNFPIRYAKKAPPYIGALDLNGEPVKDKKGAIYLSKIKKLYDQEKYASILKVVQQYKTRYSDTFLKDISLYELRALSELAKKDREYLPKLLDGAKLWIETYPSNANVPEVYMYVVQSYLGSGRIKKAQRYLSLLKSGFSNNRYTQRADIMYADTIYKSKKRRAEAVSIYKDVLYSTKDLDTASLAALRLAKAYLDRKEPKKAESFIAKVVKKHPQFIVKYADESYKIAKRLAAYERYDIALKIADILKEVKDKKLQESLLKERAAWYAETGEKERAIALYNKYLKTYKKGRYIAEVRKALDALMISQRDQNLTKKLLFLDMILQTYEDKAIVKEALAEKVKILYDQGAYEEILSIQDQLKAMKLDEWVKKSAQALARKALEEQRCEKAVAVVSDYNVTVVQDMEEKLFNCYTKIGYFKEALKIVTKNLKTDDLKEKAKWLYHAVKLYKKMDLNKKVILTGNDLLKLSKVIGTHAYDDVLYDIAEAYYNLRKYDDLMLQTVKEIEKRFPNDLRNIDLFMRVVRYAQKRKDILLEINYAKKVIELQKRYKVKSYSPSVEILYAHALQRIGKYQEALQTVLDLLHEKLTDVQKAEVLYLAGELSLALKRQKEAIAFYQKCGEIVKESAWQKLCAENLEILTQ
jgi:tetratricopeptide (TPR) repeat protein